MGKKEESLFGSQKFMIQFTDRFQFVFQPLIVVQPPLGLIPSVYGDADLLVFPPRVSDGEHPNRVSLAVSTLGASLTMANHPAEQRASQDLCRRGKLSQQFFSRPNHGLMLHS